MKDFLGTIIFSLAIGFLAFVLGIAASVFKFWPYQPIMDGMEAAYVLLNPATGDGAAVNQSHQLNPQRYPDYGVTTNKADQVQPGVTLLTGYWWRNSRWQPAIQLIDADGGVLHEWPVNPAEIWPETPFDDHVAGTKNNPNNYVHGAWLLPGGDVVFNVEYAGLVRMNACGEVVWTLPYRTHHSVFRDHEGNFWVSGMYWRYEKNPDYVHPKPDFVDETMLKVSPDGEILREIFILKSLYESGLGGMFADAIKTLDLTHMNDVETLSPEMAAAFPTLNAGDILVSLRNIGLVVIVDGATEQVKWHLRHPLVRQHDPDFEPDGHVVIFDNRDDTTQTGMRLGPTRLLRINPATNEMNTVYPLTEEQHFYTQTGGKHQLLDNGNRLITEAHGGRVFEVTPAGETVWSWVAESRDGLVPEVLEGSRYPAELADFTASCSR